MLRYFLFLSILVAIALPASAQDTTDYVTDSRMVVIVLNDGTQKVGYFISEDGKDGVIETATLGRVSIPKYQIKEVREMNEALSKNEQRWAQEPYQNRYFFTFNGIPKRGNRNYLKISPIGIDAQFGLNDDVQVGGFTSWLGAPIIGNIQGRFDLGKTTHGAAGVYIGTSSWLGFTGDAAGFLALPYASITLGDASSNFMFGYGYGYVNFPNIGAEGGANLFMLGGTTRLGSKASFVFEGLLLTAEGELAGVLTPGVRWHNKPGQAFQFGLATLVSSDGVVPIPIPALSWYKTLD